MESKIATTSTAEQGLEKSDPNFWLKQINDAMSWLSFHSLRQKMSEGIDSDPVYELMDKIGDSIVALQALGHEVPTIDFSNMAEEFFQAMRHPALRGFAEYVEKKQEQALLKKQLGQKWGTAEEGRNRLESTLSA
jgi:hypothetical protein